MIESHDTRQYIHKGFVAIEKYHFDFKLCILWQLFVNKHSLEYENLSKNSNINKLSVNRRISYLLK